MLPIIAQSIGIGGMIANIVAFQFKKKRNILLCQFVGSALFAVNMFMISAWVGAIMNVLGVARAIVYMNKDKITLPIWRVNLLFIVAYVASYALTFIFSDITGIEPTFRNFAIELLPVIGMSVMTVAFSRNDAKAIRLVGFINSPCWLIYNIFNFSLGGILCESFGLVSIVSSVIRIDILGKRKAEEIYENKNDLYQ
jgi:hypothetical protein